MRRSLIGQYVILTVVSFFMISIVVSCGGEKKLETQISGTWQRAQGDGAVEINLVNNPTKIVMDGTAYTATIESIDMGANSVHLKVETGAGNTEQWSLRQVWNDNGSSFKLSFNHNGTQETLITAGQS